MRIGRILTPTGPAYARFDGERWRGIADPFAAFAVGESPADTGVEIAGDLLAPCAPFLVVGIAQNGPEHHSPVQAWLKSPRSVVASGRTVTLRRDAGTTVVEGEIAVVIGRDTEGLTEANAHEYVLGVTAVNDISSPDRTALDPRNYEGKGGDGYTPLGPWIDTEIDIDNASLELVIDGETVASTGTAELPSSIRACIAYVAGWTRLGPGDVIMTGAPVANSPAQPGAVVEVAIAGMRLITPTA